MMITNFFDTPYSSNSNVCTISLSLHLRKGSGDVMNANNSDHRASSRHQLGPMKYDALVSQNLLSYTCKDLRVMQTVAKQEETDNV